MSKQKILENLKGSIAIENFKEIQRKKRKVSKTLQSALTVTICAVSITGIVFAKDISTKMYNNFFETGQGIENAMNNGYIENTNMEYENSKSTIENEQTGQKIDATDTKIKVSEFLMDDFNLSITFDVELSENIKDIVKAEEIWNFNFPDLVISDENNIVLYCLYGKGFDEFSKEKNLGCNYEEALDKGICIGSGVNSFPVTRENNHVKVVYNIYTGGESSYPKSKKLNVRLSQIKISKDEKTMMGGEEITLTGNWNFDIAVPKKMYDRTCAVYKQVNTTNNNYNVDTATLYDTGMELTMKIKTQKQPERPTCLEYEFYKKIVADDPYGMPEIMNYISFKERQTEEYKQYCKKNDELFNISAYLTNEKGEKFEITQGPRENGSKGIDKEGIMTYKAMFDLNKYSSTDKVTVHFNYNGQIEEVTLQKKEEN